MYTSSVNETVAVHVGDGNFEDVMKFLEEVLGSPFKEKGVKKEVEAKRAKVYSIEVRLAGSNLVVGMLDTDYEKYVDFLKETDPNGFVKIKNSKGSLLFLPNRNISCIKVEAASKEDTDKFYAKKSGDCIG